MADPGCSKNKMTDKKRYATSYPNLELSLETKVESWEAVFKSRHNKSILKELISQFLLYDNRRRRRESKNKKLEILRSSEWLLCFRVIARPWSDWLRAETVYLTGRLLMLSLLEKPSPVKISPNFKNDFTIIFVLMCFIMYFSIFQRCLEDLLFLLIKSYKKMKFY